jgi:hypothetical protein
MEINELSELLCHNWTIAKFGLQGLDYSNVQTFKRSFEADLFTISRLQSALEKDVSFHPYLTRFFDPHLSNSIT